ncbi:YlxR family protein [Chloroflexota bacterium]
MRNIKRIPTRTCLACRQIKVKPELIRLVRLSSGVVETDTGGNKAGRGAYLCWSRDCWEIGLSGGRLEQCLRITLTRENWEQLNRFSKELSGGEMGGK